MGKYNLFKLDDCSFEIAGKSILEPISFAVNSGEFWTVSGPSGSGKSTLIQILTGFLKPSAGSLLFENKNVTPENLAYLRQQLTVVFQDPYFAESSILDAIMHPFSFKFNLQAKISLDQIKSMLKMLQLDRIDLKSSVNTLSGGEKQRLALARALLLDRPILLLDEIASALNAELKDLVQNLLLERNLTVISVSHDQNWIDNSPYVMALSMARLELV